MRAKLKQVKAELRRRRHWPIPEQGRWLASVLRGHFNYYAVPGNIDAVTAFRDQVTVALAGALRRRSQRHRMTWDRYSRIADAVVAPCPHRASLPQRALRRQDPRQEPGAVIPHAGICRGGPPARAVPTGISGEGPVMGLERRGRADQGQPGANPQGEEPRARTRAEGEVV